MNSKILYNDLSDNIIKCFYNVYNELKGGFLESIYEKSLAIELKNLQIPFEIQKDLAVYYKNTMVGQFRTDIIVDDKIIIEIKAVSKLLPIHEAQLINYLKATKIKVGFLVNFGEKLEFKRKIY